MTERHPYAGSDLLGRCFDCARPETDPIHAPASAAQMNATGSPTGRVRRDAPPVSVAAARRVRGPNHRQIIARALTDARLDGLTSIEAARLLPARRDGQPQPPNIAGARFSELWEAQAATIKRAWGVCVLGVCHPHAKPGTVHRASAACPVHGPAVTRDGASVWVSTLYAPR